MRVVLARLAIVALLASGCSGKGPESAGKDPFAGACDFPQVTEVGSNAYFVGGVADASGTPLPGVTARAQPRAGGAAITETTNQGGCYFLGWTAGAGHDVTWSKPGFRDATLQNVVLKSGEKRIHHVTLQAA